jgi:hypothetical protein
MLARRQERRPRWFTPFTELAVVCALIAFFSALLLPAIDNAKDALKRPDAGESVSEEWAGRPRPMESARSRGPDLYRSACLGASVFVVMMSGGYVGRRLRNREHRRHV